MAQTNGHGDVAGYPGERAAVRSADTDERMYAPPRYTREQPVGELFQALAQDMRTLVDLEVTLAKAELSEKVSQAGKGIGFAAAGGFVIYAGFLAIVFAVIALVANFLPAWLSALIVGVVVALIGYALVRKGMGNLKGENLIPRRTLDTLKEDKEFVQQQTR